MDLEFKGTAEERRKQAEVVIMRMHRDLYGNGTPGLLPEMKTFMTKHDARESERERAQQDRHEENRLRLDANNSQLNEIAVSTGKKTLWVSAASLVVIIAGLAVSVLAIYVMVKLANHSAVDIHRMFSNAPTVLATDSAIPKVR